MKTLIVYDSFFGNTEKIALAVGKSLGSQEKVEIFRISDVKPEQLDGLRLLIIGSPTRGFRPTKAITEFLDKLPPNALKGVNVAAFDTRISVPDVNSRLLKILASVFGYAAEPIAKKLVKKGGTLIIPPAGFIVKDSEGPLKDGELERAAEWAKQASKAK